MQIHIGCSRLRIGKMTAPRLESTGDIIEASSEPVKGAVSMVRTASELERTFE